MSAQRYTEEFKVEAVNQVLDRGHSVAANLPTAGLQQCRDASVAIAAVLGRQRNDRLRERILVSTHRRHIALHSSGLAHDAAGFALRDLEPFLQHAHGASASLGAHQFPEATSLSIAFSSDRSACTKHSGQR